MKKQITIMLLLSLLTTNILKGEKDIKFGKQLFKNIHLGWDINRTDDYRWSNISLGTAYGQKFDFDSLASWKIGIDYNWSKYTLYSDGNYAIGNTNGVLRTQSVSFPLIAEYNVYKSFFTGVKVYTGPVYELILSSNWNVNNFPGLRNSQLGWTVGTKIRFLAIFSTRIAYNYYSTALFDNGGLNRSSVNFSLGF